jgi:hypothetical protein
LQGRLVGANIRPLWKLFVVENTQANCEISTITVVKIFMVKAPGTNTLAYLSGE